MNPEKPGDAAARRVRIAGNGREHVVEIDGHEVQNRTQSLTLAMGAGKLPVLTLRLMAVPAEVDTLARVVLDGPTTEALKAMGWTPPGEQG